MDDNADTALALTTFLTASGHTVKTAASATAAFELAANEPFDLMISDIGLADASGYELMKAIKEFGPRSAYAHVR